MPCPVAELTCGDDVGACVGSTILLCQQVLCGAPQPRRLPFANFDPGGEFCWLLQPHWKSAVIAAAILTFECGESVFVNRIGHDRLLEKLQDVRSLHAEVEAVAGRDLDKTQAKPFHDWTWPQQKQYKLLL